jgi:tRNA A-37 threonylcarbamoyl transferase component Bud32
MGEKKTNKTKNRLQWRDNKPQTKCRKKKTKDEEKKTEKKRNLGTVDPVLFFWTRTVN